MAKTININEIRWEKNKKPAGHSTKHKENHKTEIVSFLECKLEFSPHDEDDYGVFLVPVFD